MLVLLDDRPCSYVVNFCLSRLLTKQLFLLSRKVHVLFRKATRIMSHDAQHGSNALMQEPEFPAETYPRTVTVRRTCISWPLARRYRREYSDIPFFSGLNGCYMYLLLHSFDITFNESTLLSLSHSLFHPQFSHSFGYIPRHTLYIYAKRSNTLSRLVYRSYTLSNNLETRNKRPKCSSRLPSSLLFLLLQLR